MENTITQTIEMVKITPDEGFVFKLKEYDAERENPFRTSLFGERSAIEMEMEKYKVVEASAAEIQ